MQFCFPFTTKMFALFGPIWEIVLKKEDGKRHQQTVMWLFLSKELSREWVDLILLLRIESKGSLTALVLLQQVCFPSVVFILGDSAGHEQPTSGTVSVLSFLVLDF